MLLLLAACRPSGPVSTKNVVVVVGCTVRRDQVGPYGGEPGVTPFLQSLSDQGVRFADPIAAAPWTRAASTALFTGRHALSVGMVEPGDGMNSRTLPSVVKTLAERFAEQGYRTIGGTTNPNLNQVFGFHQGYQTYLEPPQTWRQKTAKWHASAFVPTLLEQVPHASERPLFLGVMLVDAHAPFHGPDAPWQRYQSPGLPDEVARYRYALHGLDEGVQRLHEGLRAKGYDRSNTLFVFVSDHGEGLSWPEHHGIAHGRYLYASAVEAVWIAAGPGVPPSVVDGVVSQIDLVPTLMGWIGVSTELPGVALSLSGAPAPMGRTVYTDTWFRDENRAAAWTDQTVCMVDFSDQASQAPTGTFRQGCYDRPTDPLQFHPQPGDLTSVRRWRAEHPVVKGVDGGDAATTQHLQALGYTGAD